MHPPYMIPICLQCAMKVMLVTSSIGVGKKVRRTVTLIKKSQSVMNQLPFNFRTTVIHVYVYDASLMINVCATLYCACFRNGILTMQSKLVSRSKTYKQ